MSTQAAVPNPTEQIEPTNSGVPAAAEQTPASTTGAPPANDGDDEHPEGSGKEGGYQRVKRQRDQARQDVDYWRAEAIRNRPAAEPKPAVVAAPAVVEKAKPKPEDFTEENGGMSAYLDARDEWVEQKVIREIEAKQSKTEQERSTQSEQQKVAETFQQRQAATREKYADYDDVLSENVRVSPAMAEVMVHSEQGPELAYWLGKNPEKAAEIAKLGPLAAANAMGKIEALFAKEEPAATEQVTEPAPITKAPTPINPIRKTAPVGKVFDPRDPKGDYATFEKEMNKKQFGK